MHPEQLHALLLSQLEQVEEVLGLSPDELLAEMQALQMEAMYGTDHNCAGKKKMLGDKTEDFLVQQVSFTCVAATS